MRRPTNSAVALTPRRNAVPRPLCGMILIVPVCHDGRLRLRLPWPGRGGGRWCRKSCQRWLLLVLVEAAAAAARRLAIRLEDKVGEYDVWWGRISPTSTRRSITLLESGSGFPTRKLHRAAKVTLFNLASVTLG